MRKLIGVLSSVALLGAALVVGPAATASFQGSNGKIAFVRTGGDAPGLYVMRKDGTRIRRIAGGGFAAPTWSPDGMRLAAIRWKNDGTSRLQVMNADGSDRHGVGTPSRGGQEGCGLNRPSWSYDGLFLAYADDCFDQDPRVAQLRIAVADGSAGMDLTDYSSMNHFGMQPWSPSLEESSQLAFVSDRDGDAEVYVMFSDGTEPVALTDDGDDQIMSGWSPDGSSILFTTQVIDDQGDPFNSIWLVDPQGGTPSLLVEGAPHATEPLWSPDGSMILFTRRDYYGAPTAAIVEVQGGQEIEVGAGLSSSDAAWAPAANAIVFSKNGRIVRYRPSDGSLRRLTTTRAPAYDTMPDWQAKPAM